MRWPDDKQFAFTVFDDTDRTTERNVTEVYALLEDLGMRTTKSVWPIRGEHEPVIPGATCEDDGYRQWTLELASKGFEIGYHNATFHTSPREDTRRALERFEEIYGHSPRSAANHADNDEGIYWGDARVSGVHQRVYRRLTGRAPFRGHVEGDPLFWGDLCKRHVRYVRNFVFDEIDTLAACPFMPYHDPLRPFVNMWFASSEGATRKSFVEMIDERSQDRLEEQGGACVMYTHFAKGFQDDGRLDRRFVELMTRLADKRGWFVTTSDLLDHLVAQRGRYVLSPRERAGLERRWIGQRVRRLARSSLAKMRS